MMEDKHQLFRSLGASLKTSYLNKDLNAEDDLILWGKNGHFTLLKINYLLIYCVLCVFNNPHSFSGFGYMTMIWDKESGGFFSLPVELLFVFLLLCF